jgi:site-specific DNA recombinase
MKAALYARVSTSEQAEEGHSIAAQLGAMRAYCEHMGWEIANEYVDAGISGKLQSRAQLDALMRDAQNRRFEVVVVHKLDRFFRNLQAQLATLKQLAAWDVTFVSVTESFDMSSPWGKVVMNMLGTLNEVYIDNLSAETKKGKRQRAKEGLSNASIVPYGYQKTAAGQIVPDDYEAEAIRLAFKAYASAKHSDASVAALLNDAGYLPRGVSHWGKRTRWSKETVSDTLKNSFYIGKVRHHDEEYQGHHEPLISRELWDRAQAVRADRTRLKKTAGTVYRVYLLNGIVRCSVCGQKLRVQRNAKGLSYYRHTSGMRGVECTRPDIMVRQERLAEQMETFVGRLVIPDNWQRWLQDSLHSHGRSVEDDEQERARLEKKLQRLKRAWLDLEVNDEEYQAERQRLQDRLTAMTPPETAELAQAAVMLRSMGDIWPCATLEEKRNILRVILVAVYVDVETGDITGMDSKPVFAAWVKGAFNEQDKA